MEHEQKNPKGQSKYQFGDISTWEMFTNTSIWPACCRQVFWVGCDWAGVGAGDVDTCINDMKLARLGTARTGKASLGWVELDWNMLSKSASAH